MGAPVIGFSALSLAARRANAHRSTALLEAGIAPQQVKEKFEKRRLLHQLEDDTLPQPAAQSWSRQGGVTLRHVKRERT
jgi:hypothetical protein